jgi:hypothetical protein
MIVSSMDRRVLQGIFSHDARGIPLAELGVYRDSWNGYLHKTVSHRYSYVVVPAKQTEVNRSKN